MVMVESSTVPVRFLSEIRRQRLAEKDSALPPDVGLDLDDSAAAAESGFTDQAVRLYHVRGTSAFNTRAVQVLGFRVKG